jgi:lipopolysaccharide export system protein LptA
VFDRDKKLFLLIFLSSCFTALSGPLYADIFTFRADRMSGGRAVGSEVTILQGNARVQSNNIFLQADSIELQGKNNQFIHCAGNVTGRDSDKNIYFSSSDLRYDRDLKIARLEGDSTLEDRDNGIVAKARFIEYDQDKETALLQISVRLFKEDLVCRADYATYSRKEKLLDLSGFPVVYKGTDEFRADRIRVNTDTEDVKMEGSVSGSIKQKKAAAKNDKPAASPSAAGAGKKTEKPKPEESPKQEKKSAAGK